MESDNEKRGDFILKSWMKTNKPLLTGGHSQLAGKKRGEDDESLPCRIASGCQMLKGIDQLDCESGLILIGVGAAALEKPLVGPVLAYFGSPQKHLGELISARQGQFG